VAGTKCSTKRKGFKLTEEQTKQIFDMLVKENIARIKLLNESPELQKFMASFFHSVNSECEKLGIAYKDCILNNAGFDRKTNELSFEIDLDVDKISRRSGILLPSEDTKFHKGKLVDKRELNAL
jgi:hypothetical protein